MLVTKRSAVLYLLVGCLVLFSAMGVNAATPHPSGSIDIDRLTHLDLITAQRIALQGNPSLAAAKLRLKQARQRVAQARSAYWPRLDATFSAARTYLSDSDYQSNLATARALNPFAAVSSEMEAYKNGLSLTWTIFNGFQRKYDHLSARLGQSESKQAHQDARRLLLSSVATAYHNAQLAQQNIVIAQANKAFNRRQLDDAKARRRAGTGSLSDVLNFEVRINAAESELIQANETQEIVLFSLAALMGFSNADLPAGVQLDRLEDVLPETIDLTDAAKHIEYARQNRPDIRQGHYLLEQSKSNVGSARAGYYPSLNLAATLDGARTDDASFGSDDYGQTVALSLSYNLFAGGYTRAKVAEARARQAEAAKGLESLKINVAGEVKSALSGLRSARKQLLLQQANAKQVQQNRDLVQKTYKAGQVSLVRLNEAQRDLVTAQSRLALARVAQHQARENLLSATGQILTHFETP